MDVVDDTSGDFQKMLIALIKGEREQNNTTDEELAIEDVNAINKVTF